MPETIHYIAPAKINLGLTVHGRRPDGYHEIDTVFYRVLEPHDSIIVTPGEAFQLTCSDRRLPTDERNLMRRAANLFANSTGQRLPAIHVHLEKRIPMGAGLGGGSSDAATMLQVLIEHGSPANVDPAIGLTLGADVPFFQSGAKAARATGIGEELEPFDLELGSSVLIVFDRRIHVSTKDAYEDLKRPFALSHPSALSVDAFTNSLKNGSLTNDFERSVFARYPRLAAIKDSFYQRGASFALMSGSGSSVYGLFEDVRVARNAKSAFSEEGLLTFLS